MSRWTLEEAMKNPVIREALRKDTARTMKQTGVAAPSLSSPISHTGDGVKGAPTPSPRSLSFTVYGQPVSQNACYRRSKQGRMFMSPEGKGWKLGVASAAALAMDGREPFKGDVAVHFRFVYQSRRNDLSGALKPTEDALQGVVFVNDRQVKRLVLEWGLDRERPRAEITVEDVR